MQEYWLLLSIWVTISIGIVAFTNKVFAQKNYNVQFSALVLYALMFVFAGVIWLMTGISAPEDLGYGLSLLSIVWWAQFYLYSIVMMNALKHLPTSTYFITVRLASSFILLLVWILFFQDTISNKELIWFIFGVIAMSLLFESWQKWKWNYKTGIYFLLLWIMTLVFWHSVNKILSLQIEHISLILLLAFWWALWAASIFGFSHVRNHKKDLYEILKINLIQSVCYFFYFYALFYVYNSGDLWISYKIQSYSPFIPIILAAIIYKEKITKKQWLWIGLTILSLYFFT